METGINYLVSHAFCDNCNYKWTAVIEVDYVELLGKKEHKLPQFLECPECSSKFADYIAVESNNLK